MSQPKTVVVLGASMAGVPTAHRLLSQVAPQAPGLKVILVAPNTEFFWNLASVRGVLPGQMMPDEKLFYPIAPAFAQFDSSRFEFVVGKATKLDPEAKNVIVTASDGEQRTISYDLVVIATGSSAKENMPWKIVQDTKTTKNSLADIRKAIETASSVVVAGGGMTGVEVAGELGQTYQGKKELTLIVDDNLPMDSTVRSDIRKQIVSDLQQMGVKVVTGSRVTDVKDGSNGGKSLEVTNKSSGTSSTIQADVYLPTFGVEPNTDFLPPQMLDASRRVKATNRLRAETYADVYVVGDASNLQASKSMYVDAQVAHLIKDLTARLVSNVDLVEEYKPDNSVMFAVTMGNKRGIGQMGSWKLPSFLVRFVKARTLFTEKVPQFLKV